MTWPFRALGASLFLALAGCRALLGIDDDLPLLDATSNAGGGGHGAGGRAVPAGSGGDASGTGGRGGSGGTSMSSGGGGSGGGAPYDPAWAMWPIPSDTPAHADYERAEETVLDKTTGLMWQRDFEEDGIAGIDVDDYCATVSAGGFHDWRLPSRIELESIFHFAIGPTMIDQQAFPKVEYKSPIYAEFWTSSRNIPENEDERYTLNFDSGALKSFELGSKTAFARCVRLAEPRTLPAEHYEVVEEGIVRDQWTGLHWALETPQIQTIEDAHDYCTTLEIGSFTHGWRVPWMKELLSVWAEKESASVFWDKGAFGDVSADTDLSDKTWVFWSAIHGFNSISGQWGVCFSLDSLGPRNGQLVNESGNDGKHRLRCVHD